MDISKKILSILLNDNNKCVFPSEVAVRFWIEKALQESGKKAIEISRFISWDSFKIEALTPKKTELPVNRGIRYLFTSSLLALNRDTRPPIFRELVPEEYVDNSASFLDWITAIVPRLKGDYQYLPLPESLKNDLSMLKNKYCQFLQLHDLFEPAYLSSQLIEHRQRYVLFFPECIEDFDEYAELIINSGNIELFKLPVQENKDIPILKRFPNALLELHYMLDYIEKLLDKGTAYNDIAITLTEHEEWLPYLQEQGFLRQIPLDIRLGVSPLRKPGGVLFSLINKCLAGKFGFEQVKGLLMHQGIPWRKRNIGEAVLQKGVELYCAGNFSSQGWKEKLKAAHCNNELTYYRSLEQGIQKIAKGRTFNELKRVLQDFINTFLDTSLWSDNEAKEFQFCLDILNELEHGEQLLIKGQGEQAEQKKGKKGTELDRDVSDREVARYCGYCGSYVEPPFFIWLSFLKESLYVPPVRGLGVPVYSYRVSGGIYPEHHFIAGASQTAVMKKSLKYPFLREDVRVKIIDNEVDFTFSLLQLYSLSGVNIYFSCAEEGFSGPQLVPAYFLQKKHVLSLENIAGPYKNETALWISNKDVSRDTENSSNHGLNEEGRNRLYPVQLTGFIINQENNTFKNTALYTDYCRNLITDRDLLHKLITPLLDKEGRLLISPSRLEQYWKCPFRFLFMHSLKVAEIVPQVELYDPMLVGTLTHLVLQELLPNGVSSENICDDDIQTITDKVIERQDMIGKGFLPPIREYVRDFIKEKVFKFIENDKRDFPGFSTFDNEKQYFIVEPEAGLTLQGRIDRVSKKDNEHMVVDYKKNVNIKKNAILPEEGMACSFQIPFYMYLMLKNNLDLYCASYYDISKEKYVHVYAKDEAGIKKSMLTKEEAQYALMMLKKAIKEMDKRIKKGDFKVIDFCDGCDDFRGVCRVKFHVR